MMTAIRSNPQHSYIALTKRLYNLQHKEFINHIATGGTRPSNLFVGISVTDNSTPLFMGVRVDFLSVEPLLEAVDITHYVTQHLKVVIIGAETGNRRGKVIPKKEWVDDIAKKCDENGIKVFMKESLRQIMGDDFRQDKLPWEVKK